MKLTIVNKGDLKMYSLPQEIEVWYIIPAVRREFSRVLVKKHKLTMEKAGELLGVSKAAVSQYLKGKRASEFKLCPECKKAIQESAKIMIRNPNLAVREIMKILDMIKRKKGSCKVCKKYNKGIVKQCACK